jgi:hypothetical protein
LLSAVARRYDCLVTGAPDGPSDKDNRGAGQDWFLSNVDNGVLDVLLDLTANEFADDLD